MVDLVLLGVGRFGGFDRNWNPHSSRPRRGEGSRNATAAMDRDHRFSDGRNLDFLFRTCTYLWRGTLAEVGGIAGPDRRACDPLGGSPEFGESLQRECSNP